METEKLGSWMHKTTGWTRGSMKVLGLAALIIGLLGCTEETKLSDPPQTKVEGEKITFPTNAPQLGYLAIEPATEQKAVAVGLYGRLAWDDDITVRVFSPAAGH